jgi:two-component system response regulator YesN
LRAAFPDIKSLKSVSEPKTDIYKYLKDEEPNLIIGDIRFFGMNAFQTIRNLNDMFPEIRMIFYGTYNDADYLKRSLEFGVIGYLFKPVKPAEFKKVMDNAFSVFRDAGLRKKEEAVLKTEYLESIKLFEDKFLNNVLSGYIDDDMELFRSFKYFDLDLYDAYCVCVLRVDHFKKIILTLDEMEKHMMSSKVLNAVNKNLPAKTSKAVISNFNVVSFIISGKITESDVMRYCQKIRQSVFDSLSLRVTIGAGRIYKRPREIAVSFREAQAALRYRFCVGYNNVISISFVEPENNITHKYPIEKEKRLIFAAVTGEYVYCKVLLKEIFAALSDIEGAEDAEYIQKLMKGIFANLNRYAAEQKIGISLDADRVVTTLDEAYILADTELFNFCARVVKIREENDRKMFVKVKAYCDEKYFENISVYEMAAKFGSTPDYLNNVFVNATEKSFAEFLTLKRIDEAKKLMQADNYEDDVISMRVGIEDAQKFRSLFKKYEGVFPYEYKSRYGRKRLV